MGKVAVETEKIATSVLCIVAENALHTHSDLQCQRDVEASSLERGRVWGKVTFVYVPKLSEELYNFLQFCD